MSDGLPWDFGEAERRLSAASRRQEMAEEAMREAYRAWGAAQDAYARKLAETILELRAENVPATVCLELAKGSPAVSALRLKRDVAEGVKAAAEQAAWRRNADRRDAARLADWSQRREFAEAAGAVSEPAYERPIGAAA